MNDNPQEKLRQIILALKLGADAGVPTTLTAEEARTLLGFIAWRPCDESDPGTFPEEDGFYEVMLSGSDITYEEYYSVDYGFATESKVSHWRYKHDWFLKEI